LNTPAAAAAKFATRKIQIFPQAEKPITLMPTAAAGVKILGASSEAIAEWKSIPPKKSATKQASGNLSGKRLTESETIES